MTATTPRKRTVKPKGEKVASISELRARRVAKTSTPVKRAAAKTPVKKVAAAKKAPVAKTPKIEPSVELTELRTLIKVTRDRRWRAGRRGDDALVVEMNAKLGELTARAAQLKSASS